MKVLMFGWEFPPHISGGLGTACYGLTKGMLKTSDVEILFVVPKTFGDEEKSRLHILGANEIELDSVITNYEEFLQKIRFIGVDSELVPYRTPEEYYEKQKQKRFKDKRLINTEFHGKISFEGGYGPNLFQEIADYSYVASVIADRYDFDVIHAHDWLTFSAGIAAKRISGKPLIVHVHATDFDRSGGSVNPAVFELEKNGMDAADRIIAVSNLTRNTIIEKYGISGDKVQTVHNAVEPNLGGRRGSLKTELKDKVVTFLGRITMQKGPEYFVEAAHRVLQKMDNVRFVMAGSGDMFERMIHRAASLGIGDKFHFTGFLRGNDVSNMFALSDVYVMPSVSEPFGISPLEAMQSDVPVIISHQSGVSEVLKHAIKIDFWDIDSMADAIYGILNYEGLERMFKKHGRTEVDNLKWENTAAKVTEIYKSSIHQNYVVQ
ncbi:MAG: glycosyltransferase [Bacteroidetes bacterium]|jgi:glycosyltransferase involved in cell wall biosynthesis|nr:glycosyltransferase [Bacteroidota bacterium]